MRFLCKIREAEILEPLVPTVQANLAHRHPYVRRHAILTVFSIYKAFGADLMPDAPADIEALLQEVRDWKMCSFCPLTCPQESDKAARRNAFMMLFHCDQQRAVKFFLENVDEVRVDPPDAGLPRADELRRYPNLAATSNLCCWNWLVKFAARIVH